MNLRMRVRPACRAPPYAGLAKRAASRLPVFIFAFTRALKPIIGACRRPTINPPVSATVGATSPLPRKALRRNAAPDIGKPGITP
jgi:hypothetical protein